MTERIAERNGGGQSIWLFFALLLALFAALTAVLAEIGIDGVNGTLATAIRTAMVLAMAWGMVSLTHAGQGISVISQKSWLPFILSELATGASRLCYYHTLRLRRANQATPIDRLLIVFTISSAVLFLQGELTPKSALDYALIVLGAMLMVLWPRGTEERQTEDCR